MRFQSIAPAASLLLLATLASSSPLQKRGDKICDAADSCLSALREMIPVAVPFCSKYLEISEVTVTAETVTPIRTTTITKTVTTSVNINKRSTPTLEAREFEFPPCNDDETNFRFPCVPAAAVKRSVKVSVPTPLTQYPEGRISSACSCLSVAEATITITPTAPATTTTTITITTTTATVTPRAICDITYGATGNNGSGNRLQHIDAASAAECCQKCQEMNDCVANAFTIQNGSPYCQFLMNKKPMNRETTTDKCPTGVEKYSFGKEVAKANGGYICAGPCAA